MRGFGRLRKSGNFKSQMLCAEICLSSYAGAIPKNGGMSSTTVARLRQERQKPDTAQLSPNGGKELSTGLNVLHGLREPAQHRCHQAGRSHPKNGGKMRTFPLEGSAHCLDLGLSKPSPCSCVLRYGRLQLRQRTKNSEKLALQPLQWLPTVTRHPACRLWVDRHKTSTPDIEAVR